MSEKDENQDQSFNDAELQDIMNEIENLEREFEEEESPAESAQAEAEVSKEEAPVAASEEAQEAESEEEIVAKAVEVEEEAEEPVAEETNIVEMDSHRPTTTVTPSHDEGGYMEFSGQGQVDMQMNFNLGEETATVSVKNGRLEVSLSGVQMTLTEDGCQVEMAGGVKFSVPVNGTGSSAKKAA